ncbi:MAG TPA: SDR family oxidoreductase [Bryobacteraceae bacterium]|nr:SDR family oxidoreductase [Bryobacteraceae bacterium]
MLADARATIDEYLHLFLPLSLIFPLAFLLSGMYRDHMGWTLGRRAMALLRGLAAGLIAFSSVSVALLPNSSLGVKSLMIFCAMMTLMLFSARAGEWALVATVRGRMARQSRFRGEAPVLVVGGAGYIGSMLVAELLRAGRKVRVLDSLLYGDGALRNVLQDPGLELIVGDCRNLQTAVRAVSGAASVVHLAAIVGDPACEQDRQAALETNYAATRMLVEVAKGQGVSRFLFASSCSVYGASEDLMSETSPTCPVSLYGQTKIDSEKALLDAANKVFRPTILRLATVFGLSPRPRFDLVVNLLTAKALVGHPITIFNGNQWRPFIHVSDVVRGFLMALDAPIEQVGGEVFNLGDSKLNHTLTDVALTISKLFPGVAVENAETTDRRDYRVCFDKIRARLGFECTKNLVYGVSEIQAAFASRSILDYSSYQYSNQKFLSVAGCPGNQDEVDEQVMAAFSGNRKLAASAAAAAAAAAAGGGS